MKFEEAARNQHEDSAMLAGKMPEEHHSVYCPTCSHRLIGHRCKLICQRCGYYLSCADYY